MRGIGVAVIDSTCGAGLLFSCSIARCSTPNLQAHADQDFSAIIPHSSAHNACEVRLLR